MNDEPQPEGQGAPETAGTPCRCDAATPRDPADEAARTPEEDTATETAAKATAPATDDVADATAEALEKVLNRFEVGLGRLRGELAERLGTIDESLAAVAKQVSYVPPQVRNLGGRIDGLTTSIGESRYRALLLDLLRILDLVDQVRQSGPAGPGGGPATDEFRRVIEVILTQIRQVMLMNGLSEIPADGAFDPQVHCAVQNVPCTDPALGGRIHNVVRAGWRTEHSVLRFADVEVYRHEPSGAAEEPAEAAQETADAPRETDSDETDATPRPGKTAGEGNADNEDRSVQS